MREHKSAIVLPHSLEAEKAVLGAILRRPENFHLIVDKVGLKPEHFFYDPHRKIYSVMTGLEENQQPIDIITVTELIFQNNSEKNDFSATYIIELTECCPVSQNIEHYAEIVRQKYYLRRVIFACQETAEKASTSEGTLVEFIESVEKEFLHISSEQDRGEGLLSAKDLLVPTIEELENRIRRTGTVTGVPSGFKDIDQIVGGWQPSDLIIVAARPGMGKTALALNWAMNAVKTGETQIAFFTLEMSRTQLIERLLAAEGRIDSSKLRKGDLNEEEQDRLMHAARSIHQIGKQLTIDETAGISVGEIRSRCRRKKKESGLDLVIIDYLQLMTGSSAAQKQGREREMGEVSMGLKALAKELQIPVIACAQLNRGPDARPDKRPRISDLRESGSMEQDADQIFLIYRDDYYNKDSESAGKAEVIISKNRHGETGSTYLAWMPNFVSFHNLIES